MGAMFDPFLRLGKQAANLIAPKQSEQQFLQEQYGMSPQTALENSAPDATVTNRNFLGASGEQWRNFATNPGVQQLGNILARALAGPGNQFVNQMTAMTDANIARQQEAQNINLERQAQMQAQALITALARNAAPVQQQPIAGAEGTLAGAMGNVAGASAVPANVNPFTGLPVQTEPFAGVRSQMRAAFPDAQASLPQLLSLSVPDAVSNFVPLNQPAMNAQATANPITAGADAAQNRPAEAQAAAAQPVQSMNPFDYTSILQEQAAVNPFILPDYTQLTTGNYGFGTPEQVQRSAERFTQAAQINDQRARDVTGLRDRAAADSRARELQTSREDIAKIQADSRMAIQEAKAAATAQQNALQREHQANTAAMRHSAKMAEITAQISSRENLERIRQMNTMERAKISAENRAQRQETFKSIFINNWMKNSENAWMGEAERALQGETTWEAVRRTVTHAKDLEDVLKLIPHIPGWDNMAEADQAKTLNEWLAHYGIDGVTAVEAVSEWKKSFGRVDRQPYVGLNMSPGGGSNKAQTPAQPTGVTQGRQAGATSMATPSQPKVSIRELVQTFKKQNPQFSGRSDEDIAAYLLKEHPQLRKVVEAQTPGVSPAEIPEDELADMVSKRK